MTEDAPLPEPSAGGGFDGRCVGCGAELDLQFTTAQGSVERVGCRHCGLQLIRRKGERWEAIRG